MPVAELLRELREIHPAARLFTEPARVAPYDSDALTSFRCRPEALALPETREKVTGSRASRGSTPLCRECRAATQTIRVLDAG